MPKLNQKKYQPGAGEKRGDVPRLSESSLDKFERMETVEQMLLRGDSSAKIQQVCSEQFQITKKRISEYISEIRNQWAEEERDNRSTYKTQAMRRIYGHIQKARDASNWAAVAQLERLLSDIQGTKEAVEVQLNVDSTVSEAALYVVANLTPERRAMILEQQKKLRELAAKPTIDTTLVEDSAS